MKLQAKHRIPHLSQVTDQVQLGKIDEPVLERENEGYMKPSMPSKTKVYRKLCIHPKVFASCASVYTVPIHFEN